MRFTYLKGVKTVEDENSLRFACFNMKKMVMFISKCDKNNKENNQYTIDLPKIYSKIIKFINFLRIFIRNKKETFLNVTFSTV